MKNLETMYAPAERESLDYVLGEAQIIQDMGIVDNLTHIVPLTILIINKYRQVVYYNKNLVKMLGVKDESLCILSKRPGELMNCKHSKDMKAGCGTSEFCRECGAINTILKAQDNKRIEVNECRITTIDGTAFDLKIWAYPFTFGNEPYTTVSILDISNEKRRCALERTFFHDINNILSIISGNAQLLEYYNEAESIKNIASVIHNACDEMIDEIHSHRNLLEAEKSSLSLFPILTQWKQWKR